MAKQSDRMPKKDLWIREISPSDSPDSDSELISASAFMAFRKGPEPPRKRARLDKATKSIQKFSSAEEIRAALRLQDQDALTEALTALRNQITIKVGESTPISPQDERLLLVQHWLDVVPGAQDLFALWEISNQQRKMNVSALLVSILSYLLSLLSSHYTYHALGNPIMKTLLSPTWMRRLSSYLGGSQTDLILVTLKLLNGMSSFAGGKERKSILESFAWETKSLPKLLNMRRKTKSENHSDSLLRPDIRTLYILFILSFVDPESPTLVKSAFLEQHRDAFLSVFKGLFHDSYAVARRILEVCWAGIWSDQKIKRTVKIGLFNETTISHIIKLYERDGSEDGETEHVPADLIHHFLLAICTRPGTGICFKDRGWYFRESEGDNREAEDENIRTTKGGGKIHNKILSNVLKTLKINEDLRQQELALKVLSACPELVAGYWAAAALTLEPRLSSKWIANVSFFGSIISLPVPVSSFLLRDSTLYQPAPPPLWNIVENIFPSVNTKAHLSKGLQSSSALVQHCSALALAKCLIKYQRVLLFFDKVENALEEDGQDGQWSKRRKDVEREVRKRVPEFQVIVAFSQQKSTDKTPGGVDLTPNPTKAALLTESAQRLLWLYHRCLPSLVAEARFDVGKLLQNFFSATQSISSDSTVSGEEEEEDDGPPARLHIVRQLHVLRLLKESDQFVWTSRSGPSSRSNLSILLKAYIVTEVPAIRIALDTLLRYILSQSIMFQENPEEASLWLASLPATRRGPSSESPDGARLTDEGDSVVTFLDDCVQRCLKTPYRYIEEMYEVSDLAPQARGCSNAYPSSLLMTVLEQLGAKVSNKLLSSSDVLALASFIRRLVLRLSGAQQNLKFLHAFANKVDTILQPTQLFPQHLIMTAAIRREMHIIQASLHRFETPDISMPSAPSVAIQQFLTQVEQLPVSPSKPASVMAAFELVDWLRLADQPLGHDEVARIAAVIEIFYKPALSAFAGYLDPAQKLLWTGLDVLRRHNDLRDYLPFELLYVNADEDNLKDARARIILVDAVFQAPVTLMDVQEALCLVVHDLEAYKDREQLSRALSLLLASVMKRASTSLSPADFRSLKEYMFVHSEAIKNLCASTSLSPMALEGLRKFVTDSLDPTNIVDRQLASEISTRWSEVIIDNLKTQHEIQIAPASIWIGYLTPVRLFDLLDKLGASLDGVPPSSILQLLTITLSALHRSIVLEASSEMELRLRLNQLLALRLILAESSVLEDLIGVAVDACLPVAHNGRTLLVVDSPEDILSSHLSRGRLRWSHHTERLTSDLNSSTFLVQESWTPSTLKIISGLLYKGMLSKDAFQAWLETDYCARRSTHDLAVVFHAFFDSITAERQYTIDPNDSLWNPQISRMSKTVGDPQESRTLRELCSSCLHLMISTTSHTQVLAILRTEVQSLPENILTAELLSLGNVVRASGTQEASDLVDALVEQGLHWAIRHFGSDNSNDADVTKILREMTTLAKSSTATKAHLVETVLTVVTQNQLTSVSALNFLSSLVQSTQLKPLIVNRHLQSIIQNPNFFKICSSVSSRDAIVNLLFVLFNLHPWNTCQPTHVDPLVRIYRGTLSIPDRKLLSIFQLFEAQRKASVGSLLVRWSSSADLPSNNILDAVQNLDAIRVLRTCLTFPKWRRFEDQLQEGEHPDIQIYDPVFLILIFAQMLADSPPDSAFAWVEVFRTNIVGLLIRSLSSKDGRIREVAIIQIAALWRYIEAADMQERPHVMYIVNVLKDVIPAPTSNESPRRLPSYTTLILSHALRGIFYPSNFIYPLTARFLLQRPELDTTDVPMLFGMLYSSSDDWKKERGWIIRFLSDGMMSTEDWRIFKRRHTWDLLSSLFQSSEGDRAIRNGIFDVLANLTSNAQATTSLVLKSALLAWIEMQLQNLREDESIAWIKILENILTVLDPAKMEASTNGEWRSIIARCLLVLLGTGKASSIIHLTTPVILRLGLLPGLTVPHLGALLTQAVRILESFEQSENISLVLNKSLSSEESVRALPPHGAHGLHELGGSIDLVRAWGESVEMLWRVTMTFNDKPSTWDALSNRLLIWRSVAGMECTVGEWARKEVVRNLRLSNA